MKSLSKSSSCYQCYRRYFKAGSPSRNWIINPKSNRCLPNHYPLRRGSITPVSSLALFSTPGTPNRSRSLDGLLDSESKKAEEVSIPSETAPERCTNFDTPKEKQTDTHTNLNKIKAYSVEDALDSSPDLDRHSVQSNCSDLKKKQNFMDRCVNKVRSLIRK
ncbi:hypothetical protein GWI33_016125 [Rhynchophorus ferrugineus]|uniref:Uncharacterized protein n=1 Tax=Rhynchophorus ferrugineus TaxID=354439 RepID=A0A834HXY1_RHYFE|nr:hypothetical protein GWI33_016125 [Rhynchophorus ferrugineus]